VVIDCLLFTQARPGTRLYAVWNTPLPAPKDEVRAAART